MEKINNLKLETTDSYKYTKRNIPTFILKTYEILKDPSHESIICWNSNGNGFIIKNMNLFGEHLLPIHFKSKNVYSFIRQLNLYDFHKIRNPLNNQEHQWMHPFFLRGHKEKLCEIQRKQSNQPITKLPKKVEFCEEQKFKDEQDQPQSNNSDRPQSNNNDSLPTSNQFQTSQEQNLQKIQQKQKSVNSTLETLLQQNQSIIEENRCLWSQMNSQKQQTEKKIDFVMSMLTNIMKQDEMQEMKQDYCPPQQPKFRTTESENSLSNENGEQQSYLNKKNPIPNSGKCNNPQILKILQNYQQQNSLLVNQLITSLISDNKQEITDFSHEVGGGSNFLQKMHKRQQQKQQNQQFNQIWSIHNKQITKNPIPLQSLCFNSSSNNNNSNNMLFQNQSFYDFLGSNNMNQTNSEELQGSLSGSEKNLNSNFNQGQIYKQKSSGSEQKYENSSQTKDTSKSNLNAQKLKQLQTIIIEQQKK